MNVPTAHSRAVCSNQGAISTKTERYLHSCRWACVYTHIVRDNWLFGNVANLIYQIFEAISYEKPQQMLSMTLDLKITTLIILFSKTLQGTLPGLVFAL